MTVTYHLALEEEWLASASQDTYAPPAFEGEGFIHCTDGAEAMVATANRYYLAAAGPFVVLEVDLERVGSPVRYEDAGGIFPHVYGRLPRAAVTAVSPAIRAEDGTFLGFGDASRP